MSKPHLQDLCDRADGRGGEEQDQAPRGGSTLPMSESAVLWGIERVERHGYRVPVGHVCHRASKLMPPHREFLQAERAEKSDARLQPFCDRLSVERGAKADASMMTRFLGKSGVTFKQTLVAWEQRKPSSSALARLSGAHRPGCLIFIDETRTKTKVNRLYPGGSQSPRAR
jgi:transposase